MNLSKFRFTLDLHSIQSQASIPVMVGDTSVTLIITITDGGLPYHIEDGCLAKISIKRPTGTYLEEFCIVKNNAVVEYAFSQNENTCAVPGVHVCDIVLYGADGGVVGTPRFTMVVSERVIRFDDIVLTDEDFTAVDAMVKQEVTRQAQEATRQSQEATRQEQERLRVIAENSREEAEAARTDDYKKAVQAAADAKAEADRAKKYVENFDAGLYTEKDPTVPAWAKKPNPPTAGDVGARPDTWMPTLTDIGAAPAGFGLGGASKDISGVDLDTVTANGWYQFAAAGANCPVGGYSYMFVASRNEDHVTQTIYASNNTKLAGITVKRARLNGVWYPWEYENPYMELGVEYRTTERWMGKPVYIKAIDLGLMASNTTKYIDIGIPAANAIESRFFIAGNPMKTLPLISYENGAVQAIAWLQSAQAIVRTFTTFTDYSLRLVVKYTKD